MVIISHSFKTLLSLLGFLTPQFQNFTNLSPWNFFRLVPNPTYFYFYLLIYLEICRNYTSVIITIVSNITVLVSHDIIFFGFIMPMSHGVNKKTSSSVSPYLHLPYQVFTKFVVLQEMHYQISFAVIRLFAKDNAFSKKIRFFSFSSFLVGFDFAFWRFTCVFTPCFFTVLLS